MRAETLPGERDLRSSYMLGIIVGVLLWLTGCASLQGPQSSKEGNAVDPFLQSGPVGTAPATAQAKTKGETVASAAVPAPKPASTVTSAAVPSPKPGPTMVAGSAAAKLLPPETLSPGAATLVSGRQGVNIEEDKPAATLQPLQQADWQSSGPALTLEEANRKVQAYKPSAQRLEFRQGKWHFSCELSKPSDPSVIKLYEAEAAKEVDAVLAVLAQIERDMPRP